MEVFLSLPIELIDKILEELPRGDRLKMLLRVANGFSKLLGGSKWWRKELQLDLGNIDLDLGDLQFASSAPRSEESITDWQKLYHLYREGWSITTKDTNPTPIIFNHRSSKDNAMNRVYGDIVLLTDGFIVIFGDVFHNPSSGILKVFDIDTTKIRVIENATLRINGWPSEKVKCASYFGGLLAIGTTSNGLYLFRIIIIRDAIDDDVKVMIEAIESDPFINGIYDYQTRGTKAITFDSSPSIEDVQIDAQVLQLLSKKGSDHYIQAFHPGDKDRFAMPIGHDMYTIGLRPDLHQSEKYRRRSGDNKVSASKEKLLEWGREATTYEQLYDNNGRYIAICRQREEEKRQRDLEEDNEIWKKKRKEEEKTIIEIKVLDTLRPEKDNPIVKVTGIIQATVPKKLGKIVAGTIDMCVILISMESGILRFMIGDPEVKRMNRSMWEHLKGVNVRCYGGAIPGSKSLFGY